MSKQLESFELLRMFAMLEKTLHRPRMAHYDPSPHFMPNSVQAIHNEAMRMMLYAGLMGYRPLITFTQLGEQTAGNVEMGTNHDNIVYINISNEFRNHPYAVYCILAHEICHKVLQAYGFPILTGMENEWYTDLAAFYVGFGELMVGGHNVVIGLNRKNIGYLTTDTYHRANIIQRFCTGSTNWEELAESRFLDLQIKKLIVADVPVANESPADYFLRYFYVFCPKCGHQSKTTHVELLGKKVRCPNCKNEFPFSLFKLPVSQEKVKEWGNYYTGDSTQQSGNKYNDATLKKREERFLDIMLIAVLAITFLGVMAYILTKMLSR